MADNFSVADSSNVVQTIAMKDVSGVKSQRMLTQALDASSNPFDVSVTTGLPVGQQYEEVTGSAAANNTDLVASKDVRAYRTITFQLSGTWVGTVSAQVSNDNTTWFTVNTVDVTALNAGITGSVGVTPTTRAANGQFVLSLLGTRYFRLRTTAYTSGTVVSTAEFSVNPVWWPVSTVTSPGYSINTTGPVYGYSSPADGEANSSTVGTGGNLKLYNGATWDRGRTPTTFKSSASTSSGNTAVWTPTSGKKFRIMKYMILVSSDAATSGGARITIDLQDATTSLNLAVDVYCPAVAGTAFGNGFNTGWIDLGNGKLSATINNVLNCNLSAALSSGTCRVVVCGTEE